MLVMVSRPLNRLRKIFAFYLLAMSFWSVSGFLTISVLGNVVTWFRAMSSGQLLMVLAIIVFVQALFGYRRKWAPYAIVYLILVIILMLFTNVMVQTATLDQSAGLQYTFGPYFPYLASPAYSLILVCLYELIRGYFRTQDALQRNRIRYLIIGFSITVAASLTNYTELGKYPIDIAANGVTAILIAYAILRYQLLDIRFVLRLGLL